MRQIGLEPLWINARKMVKLSEIIKQKLQLIDRTRQLLMDKQLVFQVCEALQPVIKNRMTGHTTATIGSLLELAVVVVS